ncbi:MAG: type I secretion system permease/ATPase, partial [Gammaproteobacteria bacterium]|nr:type I secretion system permease/ATPase [Gammaproteobacteria bacterium]MBU1833358.1 type I secretion system permease/ATPase [Gammaproteobacteria bacterium]
MDVVDDPLAACLLWLASEEGAKASYSSLVDGLPLVDGRLSPSVFSRAASRVNLIAHIAHQSLERLNVFLLPCVVLLESNKACLLQKVDIKNNAVTVLLPEFDMQPHILPLDDFKKNYSGVAIYCRPEFIPDKNASGVDSNERDDNHWFWSVVRLNRPVYRDILIAAFFINLLALAMPLFVMNVYD